LASKTTMRRHSEEELRHIPELFVVDSENQIQAMRLENWRPWAPSLVMARGTSNTYNDHDMSWDNTGKNGHYARFQWP